MVRSRYLRAVHPGPPGGLDPEAPEPLLECLTGVSERIGRLLRCSSPWTI